VKAERNPHRRDARVPSARRLRRDVTDAERKLWWHLRRFTFGGSHFRRQATIRRYYADFACHDLRLIIEIEGGGIMDKPIKPLMMQFEPTSLCHAAIECCGFGTMKS
jgi:very-short-patch-repair endonuclease